MPRTIRPSRRWVVAACGAGALALLALTYNVLLNAAQYRALRDWQDALASAATMREGLLEGWVREFRSHALTISRYPTARFLLDPAQSGPRPFPPEQGAAGHLNDLLREALAAHEFEAAWVVDTTGTVRASSDSTRPFPAVALSFVRPDRTRQVTIDMVPGDPPRLFAAARITTGGEGQTLIGTLIVEADPARFIFPSLLANVLATRTGETVLVRRDSSAMTVLSPLRKDAGSATVTTDTARAAFRAVQASGLVTARDYTGNAVWALARRIEGTRWHVLSKIDRAEAMAAQRTGARLQFMVIASFLLALLALVFAVWRHMRLRQVAAVARERNRFAALLDQANDPIILMDGAGVILDVNARAVEFYGYPRESLIGRPGASLRTAEERDGFLAKLHRTTSAGTLVEETRHQRADGASVPVEVSARRVEEDGEIAIVTIVRDVSARRAAEARIEFLNRVLRTVSGINSLITRETNPQVLFEQACRVAVREGGFVGAMVLGRNELGGPALLASHGLDVGATRNLLFDPTADLAAVRALLTERTVVIDGGRCGAAAALVRGVTPQACAAAPIRVGDSVHASFTLFSAEQGFFSAEVMNLLEEITSDLGFALQLVQERERAEADRRRAEQGLRESEERFRWIAEHAPDIIFRYRLEPRPGFEYVNPVVTAITGYTPEEHYADPLLGAKLVHPEDRALLEQASRAEGPTEPFTLRWLRKNGGIVWVEQHLTPMRDASGRVVAIMGIGRDVTLQHHAEQALRDAYGRMELAMAAAKQGTFEIDLVSGITTLPAQTCAVMGLPPEAMAVAGADWIDWIHPDERGRIASEFDALLHGRNAPAEQSFQFVGGDKPRWLRSVVRVVESAPTGEPLRAVGIITDVTETRSAEQALRESEERYRAIVENSPDVVARLDRELRLLYVSPAAAQYAPIPPEDYIGRTYRELGFPERLCTFWEQAIRAVFEDGRTRELEYAAPEPDGPLFFSWRIFAEYDANGEIAAVVGVSQDVSARRRLEAEYQHAQKLEAVGRLAGGVAHDFNNILTAIGGHAALALETPDDARQVRESVEEISSAAERAASLTRQLLAFSRKQVIQPRPLDLGATVSGLRRMVARLIGENIKFELRVPQEPLTVHADPSQIEQVLLNLCVNARDAMPGSGTLRVSVSAERVSESSGTAALPAGEYAVLAVSDTGTGIPADVLPHIFEPFFTTKETGRGTGLGLSSVYGIAQQAGGEVRVSSDPGRGTTFQVYLPITTQVARSCDVPAPGQQSGSIRPLTVLVAEDEDGVRSLIRRVLHARGHRVLSAASGEEAVELAAAHPGEIDVLLSDVVMPGMNGRQLAEFMQKCRPSVATVFVTGYTPDEALRDGQLSEGVRVVAKPFTTADLLRAVEGAPPGSLG